MLAISPTTCTRASSTVPSPTERRRATSRVPRVCFTPLISHCFQASHAVLSPCAKALNMCTSVCSSNNVAGPSGPVKLAKKESKSAPKKTESKSEKATEKKAATKKEPATKKATATVCVATCCFSDTTDIVKKAKTTTKKAAAPKKTKAAATKAAPKSTTKKAAAPKKAAAKPKANASKPRKTADAVVEEKPRVLTKTKTGRVVKTTAAAVPKATKKTTAKGKATKAKA